MPNIHYGPFELTSYPCALCGSNESTIVMRKRGVIIDDVFDIVRCKRCRHHYVNPRIADASIPELYDDRYFQAGGFDTSTNYFIPATAYSRRVASDVVDTIASALDRPISEARCLDIGCGPGHLLEALRIRGADAKGFDDSPAALQICGDRSLPIIGKTELQSLSGTFDAVSAIEVIEHVPDPLSFLEYLTSFLRVGGVLYVQTGNWNTVKRVAGTPYVMPEGHIHYFTPPEMRAMFAKISVHEANVFNRSWFPYRDAPDSVRYRVPTSLFVLLANIARRVAPQFAPYPIGRRMT